MKIGLAGTGRIGAFHAKILVGGDGVVVEDLGSRNGMKLNGRRITGTHPLADGDRIRIGTQELVFCVVAANEGMVTRTTGFLRHCAACRLPYAAEAGTCPNCGYPRARGDQCENCTKQLDPTELIEPRSAISGSTNLEVRETKHLHLRQSKLRDELRAWIAAKTDWPLLSTSIALKWLDDGDGLQDRGITRDLDWGIPVRRGTDPWPGMEGKVFYVWFDAPIEYIAATWEWADAKAGGQAQDADWQRWWRGACSLNT